MNTALDTTRTHASFTDDSTLTLQRHLPGTPERVWAYLTDSTLRGSWLATGAMQGHAGTPFELVWRNDELSAPDDPRPAGFAAESRATCQLTEWQAPRRLAFTWPGVGDVRFDLQPADGGVLLTVTHRRLDDPAMKLPVAAGWHVHLDILVARVAGAQAPSFWRGWTRLKTEYAQRLAP